MTESNQRGAGRAAIAVGTARRVAGEQPLEPGADLEGPSTAGAYSLSVEPVEGEDFDLLLKPFTEHAEAMKLAVWLFHARNRNGLPTRAITLLSGVTILDVYTGSWSSGWAETQASEATAS